jgi:hypothetical protein
MAALKKLDVLIRGTSTITTCDAIKWCNSWANDRQDSEDNKDENGDYIEEFFIELFDSRDGSTFKLFNDYSTEIRDIDNSYVCSNGDEIKGVITVLIKADLIEEILNSINTSSNVETRNIDITVNPYTLEDNNIKFMSANTSDDVAEIRITGNTITIFDAGAFADSEELYEVSEEKPLNLEIMIIKD